MSATLCSIKHLNKVNCFWVCCFVACVVGVAFCHHSKHLFFLVKTIQSKKHVWLLIIQPLLLHSLNQIWTRIDLYSQFLLFRYVSKSDWIKVEMVTEFSAAKFCLFFLCASYFILFYSSWLWLLRGTNDHVVAKEGFKHYFHSSFYLGSK